MFQGLKIESNNGNNPIYKRLAVLMESWINSKRLKPGTKLPSDRQLSIQLKVSPVTINKSIQLLAQKGLVERKVGAGTYIKSSRSKAKNLKIGIFCHVTPKQDYYISTVLNNFYDFWKDIDSEIILFVKSPNEYLKTIKEYSLDGVMILTPEADCEQEIGKLYSQGYPIVSIGTKFPQLKECSFGTDHIETACRVVKYLAKLGHRNIAMISPEANWNAIQKRIEGYQKGMWESQLPANPKWIIRSGSPDVLLLNDNALFGLINEEHITAFIMTSYAQIIPLYTRINRLGYKIPDDVSIIAFDDPEFAVQLHPPLTTFSQAIDEFTNAAAKKLLSKIRCEELPENKFHNTQAKLNERGSCKKLLT